MEQEEYTEYLLFLENLNEILNEKKKSQKEQDEIEKRFKTLIVLLKIKRYDLIKTMIEYYFILELLQYKKFKQYKESIKN